MSVLPPPFLLGESIGLRFLNSVATPLDVPVDWMGDGERFLNWLEEAQIVPAAALTKIRERALPGEFDRVASQARDLREWFRTLLQAHAGKPLEACFASELGPLTALLERDRQYPVLEPISRDNSATALALTMRRRWETPESLLLPIGEALASLVTSEDFAAVKACEGAACTLLFTDRSRRRVRRWCSMSACGNRAKQFAHRQRQLQRSRLK